MLVLEQAARLCLVTQSDHARLARDIIALWTGDDLPSRPWREELLLAVAEHDNGWREVDSAPLPSADTGWPCDFRHYPEAEKRRIWQLGIDRFADQNPPVALLLLLHAIRLSQPQQASPAWRTFIDSLQERRLALESLADIDPTALESTCEFLWLADTLSLGVCGIWGQRRLTWRDYEIVVSPGRLRIDPLPFAGPFKLRVPCRYLPRLRYSGETELGTELGAAHWQFLPVSVEAEPRT